METKPYTDLSDLLDTLSVILAKGNTGTFFIATDDNGSCRFAVNKGEITHCCFKRAHGKDAINEIQDGLRGRGAFSENNNSLFRDTDKVDHHAVIKQLGMVIPKIKPDTPENPEEDLDPDTTKLLKKTYRGQEVLTKTSPSTNKEIGEKPPRMYRGQIIKD